MVSGSQLPFLEYSREYTDPCLSLSGCSWPPTGLSPFASGFDLGFYLYYYFDAFLGAWNKISFLRYAVFLPWSSGVKYLTQLRNVNREEAGNLEVACLSFRTGQQGEPNVTTSLFPGLDCFSVGSAVLSASWRRTDGLGESY